MFITHKNITESLVRSLQSSFSSQSNCEISLLCDGKYLKCHRHVLALHSKHFSNLFKDQVNYPTTVCVVNMKYNHLKAMLDYMYYGRIKLHEDSEEMKQIVKCAEDLGLTALVGFITDFLKNSKQKVNHLNGVNGDDSVKRKRVSDDDSCTTQPGNESFKKPKSSTPLREPSKLSSKTATSDVKKSKSEPLVNNDEDDDEETKQCVEEEERKKKIQKEEELKIAAEKKKKEEEEAAAAEERIKKVTTKCDESASTKSCAVCNKQYKDSIDHRKVLEGITFQKKCIITGCNKSLPFRRALIDHLLKAHKIDVCDA